MLIEFPRTITRKMQKELRAAGHREIGGILMAEQFDAGSFRIVDFSIDRETGSAAHFVRSPEHHRSALEQFFDRTGNNYERFNYLGEWHSHPNYPAIPSRADIEAMIDLIHGERDIPFAVLLIVRAMWWRRIACSATLFQKGAQPEPVRLEISAWRE
jgi:integrative and conjugative element protein (TIGR02256 family)